MSLLIPCPGCQRQLNVPESAVGRIYLVRNRMYMLIAAGSKITASSADVHKFYESFKLVSPAGPGFPVPAPK